MTPALASGEVGFFGKLPGTGDFVQRRLPADFVTAWDGAFEIAVAAARATLGTAWQTAWAAAPAWRFVLAPGVCGASAWAGVTGPSVDRVGRGFPMVLAAPIAQADDLAWLARAGAGWFAAVERVWRAGQQAVGAAVDAFDAEVMALAQPLDWLAFAGSPMAASGDVPAVGDAVAAWWPSGEDRQLAAWATERERRPLGCLWWTHGAAQVTPAVRLTQGLPRPETYAAFVASAAVRTTTRAAAPVARPSDDALADLLPDFDPTATANLRALAAAAAPAAAAGAPSAVHVVYRQRGSATLIAADNGAADSRRQAAAQVDAALAQGEWWADADAACRCVLGLHAALHERREDLIDPVAEDGAVLLAWLAGGQASVFRVGAAMAWHWRAGQLRPVFVADMAAGAQDTTLRPGELARAAVAAAPGPGLGVGDRAQGSTASCAVVPGDRLALLATDTLVRVSAATLTAALAQASAAQACRQIAAAAGLAGEGAQWPLAVIEVGT